MSKKFLLITSISGLIFTMLPCLSVWAETSGTWDNGELGSGTWSIENGKLTISGTGEMINYSGIWSDNGSFIVNTPWYSEKESIYSVEVTDGITKIGSDAFAGLNNSESAKIAKSVTNIRGNAFYMSALSEITYEEGSQLNRIETGAFRLSRYIDVIIPDSVTYIGGNYTESGTYGATRRKFYCTEAQIESAGCNAANLGISEDKIIHYEKEGNHYNIYDSNGNIVAQYKNAVDFGTDNIYQRRTSYTPAEAAKHIHKGNDNFITFTFK